MSKSYFQINSVTAEVNALEAKLSTARDVKAGMMSVLLTPPNTAGQAGKIRLV